MNLYQYIRLNDVDYNSDNLDHLLLQFKNENDIDWILSIHKFLEEWFSEIDYLEIKTSGSTSEPKSLIIKKSAMVQSAKATCVYLGLKKTDTALLCLPANYIAGKMMLVRAMVCGLSLQIMKPTANPFISVTGTIDFIALSPYQLAHSLATLKRKNIRKIIIVGGSVSSKLESEVQNLPIDIYETYGMTETISHIALRKINGAGRSEYFQVIPGIEIWQDERECLVIKAPILFEGELVTNDMVIMEGTIGFKWLGRLDNVINSGGNKIFPEIVERKLEGFISANFIIGSLPDGKLGEKVILVIEGFNSGKTEQAALRKNISGLLTKYEMPAEIYYIPAFPVAISGNFNRSDILKSALRL